MRRLVFVYLFFCAALLAAWQCLAQVPMTGAGRGTPTTPACSTGGPGNCVSGAVAWWGFRGYTTAYSGKVLNVCTALDAACEDESASGGNLVLGTVGTACLTSGTCLVKTLYDQSGALACAGGTACDVTQATAADQPAFTANVLNSLACATFGGSAFLTAANSLSQVQPYSFSVVAKATAFNIYIIGFNAAGAPNLGFTASNTAHLFGGAPINATASENAFHTFQGVLNGANPASSLTVDGATTTGSGGSSAIANNPQVGAINSINPWIGEACEGGIWPSAFTSTQIANMTNNQNSYWGL